MYTAHHSGPLGVPELTVNTASSTVVQYRIQRNTTATTRVITGFNVIRFGVPMTGAYVNGGRVNTLTISPAVPHTQYMITAWALDSGTRRSATPAAQNVTTGEASELHSLHRIRSVFTQSICFLHTYTYN